MTRRLCSAFLVVDHLLDEAADGAGFIEPVLLAGAHPLDDAGQAPVRTAGSPDDERDAAAHRLPGRAVHTQDLAGRPSIARERPP